jgi:hypothetical protein
MDPAIATGEHSPAGNGSETAAHWPTLLGRMLEDVSRVVQLELQLLEARIGPSLIATADRAIAGLIMLYAGVIAGGCFLAALILLLHKWMPWWWCFTIGGVVAVACGVAAFMSVKNSAARGEVKIG